MNASANSALTAAWNACDFKVQQRWGKSLKNTETWLGFAVQNTKKKMSGILDHIILSL